MIIAVDIGGTKLSASLINGNSILESKRGSTPKSGSVEDLSFALEQLITPLLPSSQTLASPSAATYIPQPLAPVKLINEAFVCE